MTGDRTAIVTGAGKRVGREIATALLDDGWRVVCRSIINRTAFRSAE